MKKNCFILAVVVSLFCCMPLLANNDADKRVADYYEVYSTEYAKKVVDYLTHKRLMGREAGTQGAEKAMKFIVKEFKKAGYEPLLQPFSREELETAIGKPKEGKADYPLEECNVV